MSSLDVAVFVAYLISVLVVGYRAGRTRQRDTESYFLANRRLPWYVIGLSIICASISSEQLLGASGFAYGYGLAVANWEWLVFPGLSVLTFVFLPIYYRSGISTVPMYLERRYGSATRIAFALVTVLSYIIINLAGVIYSGGYLIEKVFGFNKYYAIWGLVLVAGLYCVYGGLASMAWVDVLQGTLLLSGGLLLLALGWQAIPDPWVALFEAGDRSHLMLPASHPELPWTAMVVLALSTNIYYYCSNQFVIQKCVASRSERDARLGIIFTAFLGILLPFCVSFPGLIAHALNPGLSEFDSAYPYLISTLVPIGLRGFILAGLCSAIISTIASLQNSSVTILSVDIYPRYLSKEPTQTQMIRFARVSGTLILILGATWAPAVAFFPGIFPFFQDCWALFAAPIAVVFLAGAFWRRANQAGALWTLSLCLPMVGLVYLLRHLQVSVNILSLGGLSMALAALVMVTATMLSGRKLEGAAPGEFWTKDMLSLPARERAMETSFFRHHVFWWAVMILLFVLIYAWFW